MSDQPVSVKEDPRKAKADIDKAVADARSAEAKAQLDEQNLTESTSPLAIQQRDAERRQKIVEAEKATVVAKRDQVGALIPDLTKLERGSLDVKGDQPLFAAGLGGLAIDAAASDLADTVSGSAPSGTTMRILITSDAELASSHAVYRDVVNGLDRLTTTADNLIEIATPEIAKPAGAEFVPAAIGAIAGALPGLLSLFSAHRTISGNSMTVTDMAAAAATAGALMPRPNVGAVVHDSVRLLGEGPIHAKLTVVADRRETLAELKIRLKDIGTRKSTELAETQTTIKALKTKVDAGPDDGGAFKADLATAQEREGQLQEVVSDLAVKAEVITGVLAAIDSFVTSLSEIPMGATRSALTLAAIREHLRDGDKGNSPDPERFSHVLFVKGNGGSFSQTVDDKPFWMKDRFAVVATASITYMLVETATSTLVRAGNTAGSAQASGRVGVEFELKVDAKPIKVPITGGPPKTP